jgi:hypothetical protein
MNRQGVPTDSPVSGRELWPSRIHVILTKMMEHLSPHWTIVQNAGI